MKVLAYCILARPGADFSLPKEIAGREVRLVTGGALAAAVSDVPVEPAIDAGQVLAFEAVVEWFHARLPAVIPVRFGSVFADEAAAAARLRSDAAADVRLLGELEGAVEVGLRVLVDAPSAQPEAGEPAVSGAAWLQARRGHYLRLDGAAAGLERLAARLRSEFAGLFRRSCQEMAAGMLSLYFLVPRPGAELFVARAAQVRLRGARVLVSGPWPPYNFAVTARAIGAGDAG